MPFSFRPSATGRNPARLPATLSLRSKFVLALALTSLLSVLLVGAIGWQAVDAIRHYLGASLVRNTTLLNRERLLAPVLRELALSQRLAKSQVVRQWLLDEENTANKTLALREADDFRRDFADHSYFLISALSNNYYFNDDASPFSAAPRYQLAADASKDAWFFRTLANTAELNINVDIDVTLGVTKIWFNVLVMDAERKIGLAGSGLDLTAFLQRFANQAEAGVTPIVIDANGAIQVHPDRFLIAYDSATKAASKTQSIFGLLRDPQDEALARAAFAEAAIHPGEARLFEAGFQGKPQVLAVSYIPELRWYVVTAVDLAVARLADLSLLLPTVLAVVALLLSISIGLGFTLNRLLFRPLLKLTQSARTMAAGDYNVELPPARNDEIGALTHAFAAMVDKVQLHTQELEQTVQQRTQALLAANREMAQAHRQIHDSIAYASLIQRAILPEKPLASAFGGECFVLWRPRDVVGGDFYLFRQNGKRLLLGLADCAGHGVAGACMTMLAYAAIDQAIGEAGMDSPAAILQRTDSILRAMPGIGDQPQEIATHIDAGLIAVDLDSGVALFSGAKIALYWSDGGVVSSLKGARRALAERQREQYRNEAFPLQKGFGYYLTSDGFLDQSGGEKGFGFGVTRFTELLQQQAGKPVSAQKSGFESALAEWRGNKPQRDDVTVLGFRFPDAGCSGV